MELKELLAIYAEVTLNVKTAFSIALSLDVVQTFIKIVLIRIRLL